MAKVLIIYESKYGNTRLVAEKIIEGMKQVSGLEAELAEVKKVALDRLARFDAILTGSPNHMGRATGSIRKFIDSLGKLNLEGKKIAVFDTYMGADFERAVKKMEKQIKEKAPQLKLIAPGLSIRVMGTKGPIVEGKLDRSKDFGSKIASLLHTGHNS